MDDEMPLQYLPICTHHSIEASQILDVSKVEMAWRKCVMSEIYAELRKAL